MSSKPSVFVASASGWVAHGPARASLAQAESVARSLVRRLGWVAVAAFEAPASCPASALPVALAGLSPVWKDPGLAARWAAGAGAPRGARRVALPAAPAEPVAPAPAGSLSEELALVGRAASVGLVLR